MKINRRNFIIKFILGLISVVWLDGFWFEKYIVDWKSYDLSNKKSDSIRTIQLSDLHLLAIKSFHRSLAHRINKEKPNVLFLTGDSIGRNYQLPVLDEFLSFIDKDIIKFAILGNTEVRGVGLKKLKDLYDKHNCYLLINERHYLKIGERTINIIGIDDLYGGDADFYIPASISEPTVDTVVLVDRPF